MKSLMIVACIVLLSFSGCSQRVITQKEMVCVKQSIYDYGEEVKVRVHPLDESIHKARVEYLKGGFDFYKNQVKRNNSLCDKNNNK